MADPIIESGRAAARRMAREKSLARRRMRVDFAQRLLSHRSFRTGFLLFSIIVLMSILADWVAPFDPNKNNYRNLLEAPSAVHWLGTDAYGRDILSRIVHGTRVSLRIGIFVVITSGLIGVLIGTIAAYVRWSDNWLMRLMDGLMAFPGVLLAIALAAALGPSETNAIIALVVTFSPRTARVVRSSVLLVQRLPYVESAVAVGAGHARIIFRYILANSLSPLIVQLTFVFAVSILAEAILSFLGVGPPPPQPTLGNIIAEGRSYVQEAPWVAFFPGLIIATAVLGLNLMGDGLRDIIDPRMRAVRTAG